MRFLSINNFLILQVCECTQNLPVADAYILEAQHHRTVPSAAGFLGISIQLRILEAMFLATIMHLKQKPLYIIQPRMRFGYFDIRATHSAARKKASVNMVDNILSQRGTTPLGSDIVVPDTLQAYFYEQNKQDDLSDSLLQALAFMEWNHMDDELA